MSSNTPRTDAALEWVRPMGNDDGPPNEQYVCSDFARELERENNALRAKVGELERLISDPHAMHAHYLRIGNGWEVWTHERVRGMEKQIAELEQDKARLESEVLDAIEDAARGACHTAKQNREHNGIAAGSLITDSGAISANAENLRRLAEAKRFRIIRDFGRMVIGYWPENDPNRSKELT